MVERLDLRLDECVSVVYLLQRIEKQPAIRPFSPEGGHKDKHIVIDKRRLRFFRDDAFDDAGAFVPSFLAVWQR